MSKYLFVAEPPSDFVYLPYRQNPSRGMFLVAQSSGAPAALAAPLRGILDETTSARGRTLPGSRGAKSRRGPS